MYERVDELSIALDVGTRQRGLGIKNSKDLLLSGIKKLKAL